MDLARLASRFGLAELPELVRMEREIEDLEAKRLADGSTNTTNSNGAGDIKVDAAVYASRVAERKISAPAICFSNPPVSPAPTSTSDCSVSSSAAEMSTIMVEIATDCDRTESVTCDSNTMTQATETLKENASCNTESTTIGKSGTSVGIETIPSEMGRFSCL